MKNKYLKTEAAKRAFAIVRDLQDEARRLSYLLPRPELNEYLYKQGELTGILVNLIIANRDDSEVIDITQNIISRMLENAESFRVETGRALENIRQEERDITAQVEEIEDKLAGILADVQVLPFDTGSTARLLEDAKRRLVCDLDGALKESRQERKDYKISYGFLYEGVYLILDEVREDCFLGTAHRLAAGRASAIETGKIICRVLDSGVSRKKLAKLLGLPKEGIRYLEDLAHGKDEPYIVSGKDSHKRRRE